MLTRMVEQLIQQEPTLLAQRTVDTRRYIIDQWDRTHRETHWQCSSVMKRTAACPRNKRYSPERKGRR